MKKVLALILALTLVLSMFAACGKQEAPKTEEPAPAKEETVENVCGVSKKKTR